ncbi:MAG: AAA family ATPase [Methanomicrobiales archaeon]|nr:AAA family ATPase [Methanomicrobiales archaeon]
MNISFTELMHLTSIRLLTEKFPTWTEYPFNLEIFQKTEKIALSSPVTFFIGENGTGKSTLLRAIARASSIHIWKEERGRYRINRFEDELYRFIDLGWKAEKIPGAFFASEMFRYFAQILDEWAAADPEMLNYFGRESLMEKSHGQSHMAYFSNRFRIRGLYLLDEPENALSPRKQLELVRLLHTLAPLGDAQFIIVTHSPILLACPGAEIYSFDHVPVQKIDYEQTDYFRIFRDFLNDRSRYLTDD